ncbi:MAG: HAD-IIB family hydrolase [Nitrospiraceae bacterium]|nr:HAD-IIB family hydrolase [Nitrospiraceae bacterium]
MKKVVIFTDLDGTLLDYSTYSFEKALPALDALRARGIPLVISSSKTRREIEHYRKKLDNSHPFISENGGGIFIPKGYFRSDLSLINYPVTEEDAYHIIRLGAPYTELRRALETLRNEGYEVQGFGDMSIEELVKLADMKTVEAVMAKDRYFDEPFVFIGQADELPDLLESIRIKGFNCTKGRFWHLLGNSDKGVAVSILADLYKKDFGDITTAAFGDSLNDLPMLQRVDYPVVVQQHDSSYDEAIQLPNLVKAGGIGPEGWNMAVLDLLSKSYS